MNAKSGIILAIVTFTVCVKSYSAAPTVTVVEQGVIESLLAQDSGAKREKKHFIKEMSSIWMSETYAVFSQSLREQAKDRDKAFKEAVEDFLRKNKSPVQIVLSTNTPPKNIELVSDTVTRQIFSREAHAKPTGWEMFYLLFPDAKGLMTISRVGMDGKGTVAIVFLGQQAGGLAGSGAIRVLRLQEGKWILQESEQIGSQWAF